MPERPGPGVGTLSVVTDDGVTLAGEESGAGPAIVLLHGLTATRRYVVMGSRLLERSGLRVVAYDARGHGRSTPAPEPGAYGYDRLTRDLPAVLDALGIDRAILAGASMGAHTLVRFTLRHPERVAALALITPFLRSRRGHDRARMRSSTWDTLAGGLRDGGVEGFLAAYDFALVPRRVASDGRNRGPPASVGPRPSRGGGGRAASSAALAPVRAHGGADRHRGPNARDRKP